MTLLRWLAVQLTERIGYAGIAALVLLCGTAVYYANEVQPLHRQLQTINAGMATANSKSGGANADPAMQVERFREFFRARDLESQLKGIHESGEAAGVMVKRIEYRMLDDRRARLRQYQIIMPVTSSYPNIRKFVAVALNKVPAMSLDHIGFQRKRAGDAMVDAELRFTLFLADPV